MDTHDYVDSTDKIDVFALGTLTAMSLPGRIQDFLATHPVPRGVLDGLNIVFGLPTTNGGMNRIGHMADGVIDSLVES